MFHAKVDGLALSSLLFSPFSLITFVWWSFCCVLIFTLHVAAFPTCGTNYESCQGPSDPLQTPKVHICAVWLVIRHSRRARVCCMCEQAAVVKGEEKTSRTTLKHESSSMSAQNEEDRRCTAFSMVVSHMRYNMSEKWILFGVVYVCFMGYTSTSSLSRHSRERV